MPRAGLDRDRVVAAAAEVADATGWAGLTLAAVAARCGVRVPSLYKHVHGLDDLRREVAARALRDLDAHLAHATVGRSGPDALHALGHAYRDFAHRCPGRHAATLTAPDRTDPVLAAPAADLLATVTAALHGYDLHGDARVDAVRALRAALLGFTALEAVGGFGLPRDVDRSFDRLLGTLHAGMTAAGGGVAGVGDADACDRVVTVPPRS